MEIVIAAIALSALTGVCYLFKGFVAARED